MGLGERDRLGGERETETEKDTGHEEEEEPEAGGEVAHELGHDEPRHTPQAQRVALERGRGPGGERRTEHRARAEAQHRAREHQRQVVAQERHAPDQHHAPEPVGLVDRRQERDREDPGRSQQPRHHQRVERIAPHGQVEGQAERVTGGDGKANGRGMGHGVAPHSMRGKLTLEGALTSVKLDGSQALAPHRYRRRPHTARPLRCGRRARPPRSGRA